jgi:NAD(P)-dependent dehydrogenase (short-subunit alcohol dehydrogenase family)
MELANRVIVITGAGSGIGAALARTFDEHGAAHVAAVDIDGAAAAEVAAEIGGSAHQLDAADETAVADLVARVSGEIGPIDVMCANAGIAMPGGLEAGDEAWQRSWDVNVMSQVYAARAALPGMLERGEGYLLLTASAAGLTTSLDTAPYAVTKHASVALAEWLAITYGDRGIGVSCLAPQFVDTAMGRLAGETPSATEWARSLMITPEEVAESVVEGLQAEQFLIVPHPEVTQFFQNKAGDYQRWLAGMRKLRSGFDY